METTDVRRLVRRRDDRIIAGVCGGIADHFAIDVTVVRVGAVVLTLFGGAGLLLYAVGWAMIPEEGRRHAYADRWMHRGWQPIAGVILIIIAVTSVSGRFWHMDDIGFPLFLIGLGAFLLWFRPPIGSTRFSPPSSPPPPSASPDAPTSDPTVASPLATDPTASTSTATDPTVSESTSFTDTSRQAIRDGRDAVRQWRREQVDVRREWHREQRRLRLERRNLTAPTIGVLAIGAGAVGIALANDASVDATRVLAGGLVIVGVALVVATVYGRAAGLIPIGILLLVATTAVAVVTVPFKGGVGQRTYRPASTQELRDQYHLALGELHLDLRAVRPASGSTQHLTASVGIGHLLIDVPSGVEVVIHGHSDVGDVSIAGSGNADGGWKVDQDSVLHRGQEGAGKIDIDAQVGFGQVEVRDAA